MVDDHSLSYQGLGLRAFGHRNRLNWILRKLGSLSIEQNAKYCDLGCSNGYITDIVSRKFKVTTYGFDHEQLHLIEGRKRYPHISFFRIDLNTVNLESEKYDIVTCFEVIEHVGNIPNAIQNIVSRIAPGGKALISVPIEHGLRGFIKYFVKRFLFGYGVSELGISEWDYFKILVGPGRISRARLPRVGFGTHFGFDYRDVDDALRKYRIEFSADNKGMTRFYLIQNRHLRDIR
jgi:SAM-dependent methyltransferase